MSVQITTYSFSLIHWIFNLSTKIGAASNSGKIENIPIPWPDRTFWEAELLSPDCSGCRSCLQVWVGSMYTENYKRRMPSLACLSCKAWSSRCDPRPPFGLGFTGRQVQVTLRSLLLLTAKTMPRPLHASPACRLRLLDTSRCGLPCGEHFGGLGFWM